jgi:hypothetical protein
MSVDQVLEHRHVAHRLDRDRAVAAPLGGLADARVAGERGAAVDAHAARAADGGWHEQRIASDPSWSPRTCRMPSRTGAARARARR